MIFHCLSGLPTHVLLKSTGLRPPGQLNLVELVSSSGHSLRTVPVPLPSDLGQQGLWSLPQFRSPSQSFFIKVMGKDDEGYRFQRLSSVSYTSVIPGKTTRILETCHHNSSRVSFTPHQTFWRPLSFVSWLV